MDDVPIHAAAGIDTRTRIDVATEPGHRHALYRFRYDVYVTEMNRKQPDANHEDKTIEDALDRFGHNIVATRDGIVVGCARVNFGRDGDLGDYEDFYALTSDPWHPLHTAIVTRLMVAPELRRTRLPGSLCAAVYEHSLRAGIKRGYIDCNPPLQRFFRHLGFAPYIGEREHPCYGRVLPMRMDLEDAEHFAAVRSPFLASLLALRPASPNGTTCGPQQLAHQPRPENLP